MANFLKKRRISFKFGICKHPRRKPKIKVPLVDDSSCEDLVIIMNRKNEQNSSLSISSSRQKEEKEDANSLQIAGISKQPSSPLLLLLSSYNNKNDDGSSRTAIQSMESFLELTRNNNLNAMRDLIEQCKHFNMISTATLDTNEQKQNNLKYFDINYRGQFDFN